MLAGGLRPWPSRAPGGPVSVLIRISLRLALWLPPLALGSALALAEGPGELYVPQHMPHHLVPAARSHAPLRAGHGA